MTNQSIHPRVVGGRTTYEKVNTAKSPNPETKKRVIEALTKRVEEHPHDGRTTTRLSNLKRS